MSARGARVPVLLGPVACIGCASSPLLVDRGASPSPLKDSVSFEGMVVGGANFFMQREESRIPTIARQVNQTVSDPCHFDVRISKLRATAFGIAALVGWMEKVEVELEAIPIAVANGSCAPPRVSPKEGIPLSPVSTTPEPTSGTEGGK